MGWWRRPTPPQPQTNPPQWLLKALGPTSAAACKAAMVPWSGPDLGLPPPPKKKPPRVNEFPEKTQQRGEQQMCNSAARKAAESPGGA